MLERLPTDKQTVYIEVHDSQIEVFIVDATMNV